MPVPSSDRNIETTVLSNGLKVITETMSHVRSVSVGLWLDSGSRREVGDQIGISHFIEHMVFKGTASRSAQDIARSMDSLGGHLDAFTGKEMVSFNTKVLDEHLPQAFTVLADMLQRPAFREEDIGKEKGVILEELKMENDSPEYQLHETFSSNFWKEEPLGQPILGTRETIQGFNRQMVNDYYRRVYIPANLIITAAGNLSHAQMADLATAEFGDLKPGEGLPDQKTPRTQPHLILKNKKELEQVHLMIGMPAYRVAHPNRFAAYLLNTLLGGSMSSRLFQNIREQRGLVYSVFSEVNAYRDSGCIAVYAGTSRESLLEVIDLVVEEFRMLKADLVSEEEMVRSKNHLKGSVMLGLESTSSRMSNLARQQLYFGRFASMDEILAAIESVTAEQVRQVACEFFDASQMAVCALGRLGNLKIPPSKLKF